MDPKNVMLVRTDLDPEESCIVGTDQGDMTGDGWLSESIIFYSKTASVKVLMGICVADIQAEYR